MKYYALTALLFLSFLFLGSVVLDSSNEYQKTSSRYESINRTSDKILIYTINSYELEQELKALLELHQHSTYLSEHKNATCTIYKITEDQLQITVSPNGDGLGNDRDADEKNINNSESLVSFCLDWLEQEQTNCLTLRNVNSTYRAYKEEC